MARFMMIVKASEESEAGVMPAKEEIAEMGRFNERMAAAGAMLAGEGLRESAAGARVTFSGGRPVVTEGPFAGARQLIAGYWVIRAADLDEALEWARQVPFKEGEIEVRQIFETSDFPADVLPPEEAAREEALREELRKRAGG
ncbi:DGPFAETKE domain-containing protein [Streptomyces albireticuli]|uniref:DGPFAETKE domain-containing protein n=1 Tax=Streptomyces albireticuli TaxID=1940 RepID=A0A1Z2L0Z3_9ACTN|nr:YciI family protein [Streptomyces albireticuli]ARZ67969.1 DGPFAETKE domain-containing protein [Streptomyces albireticuli]